jgi:[acyl-carrier-protein] S-malonyltransferase
MFSGQGSQKVGMGSEIYDKYPKAKEIIDLLGQNFKKIIFEGPANILNLTKYAQPAIFAVSVATFEVFKSFLGDLNSNFVAVGHSLGEYSALYSAGFFGLKDGLSMVIARGKFIQEASEKNPGIMAAVIGLEKSIIKDICSQVSSIGVCETANFNSPEQIVITGTVSAVNKAIELARVEGAKRIVVLNVSGAFHSSLMSTASERMAVELRKYNFNLPSFGVYTNYDAALTMDTLSIKEKLIKQIRSPVKWSESIQNIIATGCDKFIEIGPGRVLAGFLKKIDKSKKVFNVENSISLKKTLEELAK